MAYLPRSCGLIVRRLGGQHVFQNNIGALAATMQQDSGSGFELFENRRTHFSTLAKPQYCDTFHTLIHAPQSNNNISQRRFKKKGKKKAGEDDEPEEEEDDDEDLSEENPLLVDDLLENSSEDGQEVKIDVGSLRLDAVCKVAFPMSRAKIEELFYKGHVLINGERPNKKSADLYLNDEVDIILRPNIEDPMMVDVKRFLVVGVPDKANETGRVKLTIRKWQNLVVEDPNKRQRSRDDD